VSPIKRSLAIFWRGAGIDRAHLALALPQLPDTADELIAVARDVAQRMLYLGRHARTFSTQNARALLVSHRARIPKPPSA
jgi:hypothetical protein